MLESIDTHDYVSGGYFLVKRLSRPQDVGHLMPDFFVTLSACFMEIAPDIWADAGYNVHDDERAAEAHKFGIPATAVPALVNLFTQGVGMHHLTNAFPSLGVAQAFYRYCADKTLVALLGIGIERSLIPSLHTQLHDDANRGYGLIERVNANIPLERGGEVLGYEPLGYEATKFHSWLCHNAPVEAYNRYGVRPNRSGFIDSFADAVRVTRNLKATGAETAIWEPWLVVQYGNGSADT
jgi:hypothetical protein